MGVESTSSAEHDLITMVERLIVELPGLRTMPGNSHQASDAASLLDALKAFAAHFTPNSASTGATIGEMTPSMLQASVTDTPSSATTASPPTVSGTNVDHAVASPPYSKRTMHVAVCGAASFHRMPSEESLRAQHAANAVGVALARAGCIVITGGMGGVMLSACRGAKAAGGLTVGILPGGDASEANPFVDVPLPTDLGQARNALLAQSDALVCIGGGEGTVSELMHAWSYGRPVIVFRGMGETGKYADRKVGDRRTDMVIGADNADDVLSALCSLYSPARFPGSSFSTDALSTWKDTTLTPVLHPGINPHLLPPSSPSSKGSNVGILAIEPYIPFLSVKQSEMETADGVDTGKYTVGLGQDSIACCSSAEDAVSMALTAVDSLLCRYGITGDRIGCIIAASESAVDRSKTMASRVLRLLGEHFDGEVFDVQAACASGTIALLQACRWIESRSAGGHSNSQKNLVLVVASDFMLYPTGRAKPTAGSGAVAMLVGCNAPLRVDLSSLVSHARDVNDFCKPHLASEFPVVDGKFSQRCYLESLEHCLKLRASADVMCGVSSPLLDRVSRVCVHSPYHGIARKAARLHLGCNIAGTDDLDVELFDQLMADGSMLVKETGNAGSASLFLELASTLRGISPDAAGERMLMFSYGSGLSAFLFEIEFCNTQAGEFKLCNLQQFATDSISRLLTNRMVISPEKCDEIFDSVESRYQDIARGASWTCQDQVQVRENTWFLAGCDERGVRRYERL